MKNILKKIKTNLSEIKEFTNLSDRNLKKIFKEISSRQLKEYLSDYNCECSQSFTEFIETNDHKFLINWIFEKEIN